MAEGGLQGVCAAAAARMPPPPVDCRSSLAPGPLHSRAAGSMYLDVNSPAPSIRGRVVGTLCGCWHRAPRERRWRQPGAAGRGAQTGAGCRAI